MPKRDAGIDAPSLQTTLNLDRRGSSRTESPGPVAPDEWDALEGVARTLTASGWYRVVRRFRPRSSYASPAPAAVKRGLYVDVETTGLDTTSAHIIELALVPFEFDDAGRVYGVHEAVSFFEDPGVPIPPEITHLTGIDDDLVRGHRIDDARVNALLGDCALVIAHNAEFDRRMMERRLPKFADVHWACSQREVPWRDFGGEGAKLEYLLYRICGEFHDGHRAADDCLAGLHLLAQPELDGRTALAYLLESSRQETSRVWAVGAPFATKDLLKARGYRFNNGAAGPARTWYRDVRPEEAESEVAWLNSEISRSSARAPEVVSISAKERYSARC